MSDKAALKPLELASDRSGLPESCQKDLGNILMKKTANAKMYKIYKICIIYNIYNISLNNTRKYSSSIDSFPVTVVHLVSLLRVSTMTSFTTNNNMLNMNKFC